MNLRDPLHLAALLYGVTAAAWGLMTFVGGFFALGLLTALAGAIVLLFARTESAAIQTQLRAAAIVALALHGILILLFAVTTPVNIGRDPDVGVNLDPAAWAVTTFEVYTVVFIALVSALLPLTFMRTWRSPERVLGSVGLAAVLVVLLLSRAIELWFTDPGEPHELGQALKAVLLVGYIAVAAALLVPPIRETHPPWRRDAPRPAGTGNP